jgi:hypothetical protein
MLDTVLSGIEVRNAWSVDFTAPCLIMAQCFKAFERICGQNLDILKINIDLN